MITVQEALSTLSAQDQADIKTTEAIIDKAIQANSNLDRVGVQLRLTKKVEREIVRKYQDGGWVVTPYGNGMSNDCGLTFTIPSPPRSGPGVSA